MIPRTAIQLDTAIPAGYGYWTPKSDDLTEEGFGYFRGTVLIRDVGVREARDLIAEESTLASLAAEVASDADEFEQVAKALEGHGIEPLPEALATASVLAAINDQEDEEFTPLCGLELGVAGLVYALAAVRCWPAASCRGHPGERAWADHPVVFLAADRHRAEMLRGLVEEAHCGFGEDAARRDLLMVEAASIEETMALARLVLDARKRFVPRRKPRAPRADRPTSPHPVQTMLELD